MVREPSSSLLTPDLLLDLHARLTRWYGEHARPLPWRQTKDPYPIWLSEVILQQTQVVQGMSYYYKFLELFPRVEDLAAAQEDTILHAWQGLGYYSRGRNLLRAAQTIMTEHRGVFPRTLDELRRLPGIGPYTGAAILSFAYDLPYATVDGNVYRVLSRLFADPTPIDSSRGQRHYRELAEGLLNTDAPGLHNQAMIELGALVCTPRKPDCSGCPLRDHCQSHALGNQLTFPIKTNKPVVTDRYLDFFLIRLPKDQILIERRSHGDIWQGLYQLPLLEHDRSLSFEELIGSTGYQTLENQLEGVRLHPLPHNKRQHRLTHRLLHTRLFTLEASAYLGNQYMVIRRAELDQYALPTLLYKLLDL